MRPRDQRITAPSWPPEASSIALEARHVTGPSCPSRHELPPTGKFQKRTVPSALAEPTYKYHCKKRNKRSLGQITYRHHCVEMRRAVRSTFCRSFSGLKPTFAWFGFNPTIWLFSNVLGRSACARDRHGEPREGVHNAQACTSPLLLGRSGTHLNWRLF